MGYDWYAKAIIDKIKAEGGFSDTHRTRLICPKCGSLSDSSYREHCSFIGVSFTGLNEMEREGRIADREIEQILERKFGPR